MRSPLSFYLSFLNDVAYTSQKVPQNPGRAGMPSGEAATPYSTCGFSLMSSHQEEAKGIDLNTMLGLVRNGRRRALLTCCPLPCRSVGPCTTLEDMCPCAWTRSTWSTSQEGPWHTATGWRKYGSTSGVRIAKGRSTSSTDKPSLGR